MTTFSVIYTSAIDWCFVRINDDGSATSFLPGAREEQDLRAYVQGLGQTPAQWFATFPPPPAPTAAQVGLTTLQGIMSDYLLGFIEQQELGSPARLNAVKAKIATWKSNNPGVIP